VNAADHRFDLLPELAVSRDALPCGDADLDQCALLGDGRLHGERSLERFQAFDDALRVVQTVDG